MKKPPPDRFLITGCASGIGRHLADEILKRGHLEGTFLLQRIPAWSTNLSKRLVRSPKIALVDSGLLCHLQGLNSAHLAAEPQRLGPVLENFVIQELLKQISWSRTLPRLLHFRTHSGQEVDALLEDAAGRIVGVEVKARATVTSRDFGSLRALADILGDRFIRGVVLYTGSTAIPFGERLHALPVSWLWRGIGDDADWVGPRRNRIYRIHDSGAKSRSIRNQEMSSYLGSSSARSFFGGRGKNALVRRT